jgi:farnesyl-diphosphate farnesyltransferase
MDETTLLTALLRDVSRSFYLTLRVLPARVSPQIGLAYLLARATDTIADTKLVPVDHRMEALERLRSYIAGQSLAPPDLTQFQSELECSKAHSGQPSQTGAASTAERLLLCRIGEAVVLMRRFSPEDQGLIRAVLDTITGGQLLDLERFARSGAGKIRALKTEAELDDYLYRVAGCVGEFWTRICRAHLFPRAPINEAFLLQSAIRFGKGLQLTNILRDLSRDLGQGRCYLPAAQLRARGLEPADLLNPHFEQRFRPVFDRHCRIAIAHLKTGWDYTNHIPRSCLRVRLACAWPILIGKRTLERLRERPALGAGPPIKISRNEVRRILIRSILTHPWPGLWRAQWREIQPDKQA